MAGEDVLAELLPATFNGIQFPVTRMTMAIAHDLAMHTYWGVDGARIEATGLEPTRFSFVVPFTNKIFPGKKENWQAGRLYPYQLRGLMGQFVKKADGTLKHPEFGEIRVKAEKFDIEWSAERRGGADGTFSFIETLPPLGTTTVPWASPVQNIAVACANLDASEADLRALIPQLPKHKTTFADFARAIQGIADQITILQYKTFGAINQLIYRCDNLSDAIDRARSASTWPTKNAIERVREAAYGIRREIVRGTRTISLYAVPFETTLSGIAASLPDVTIADLIKLNPQLVREPTIPKDTVVRYYKSNIPV